MKRLYEETTSNQREKSLGLAFKRTILSDEYCEMSPRDRDEFVHVMGKIKEALVSEDIPYCHQKKGKEKNMFPEPHKSMSNNAASEVHDN